MLSYGRPSQVQAAAILNPLLVHQDVMPARLVSPCCGDRLELRRKFLGRDGEGGYCWDEPTGFVCDNCDQHWDLDGEPVR